MNPTEQKRQEKLSKRFKPVLDDKQKLKTRFKSLESFLEFATEADILKSFQSNDEAVYYVVSEMVHYRIIKIRERTCSITSKESNNLIELLDIYYKVIKACHVKISQGWNGDRVFRILQVLLSEGNHTKLRKIGMKQLLFILSHDKDPNAEFVKLFTEIIPLGKLSVARIPDAVKEEKPVADKVVERSPTHQKESSCQSTTAQTPEVTTLPLGAIIPKDSSDNSNQLELYKDILDELKVIATTIAADANFGDYSSAELLEIVNSESSWVLRNMWTLFHSSYLRDLFPHLSEPSHHSESIVSCPKEVLNCTLEFLVKYGKMPLELTDQSKLVDQTNALLHTLFFIDQENSEISHEMIRQACYFKMSDLVLPLVFNLVYYNQNMIPTGEVASEELLERQSQRQKAFNVKARRFLTFQSLLLTDKPMALEAEYNMYKDLIIYFRYLIMDPKHYLEESTWDGISRYLLDFQRHLCQAKNPVNISTYGPEVNTLLSETIWICWIRTPFKKDNLWKELEEHMCKVNQTTEVSKTWASILLQLTSMLNSTVYGVPNSALKDDPLRFKRVRIKTRELASTQNLTEAQPKKEREASGQELVRPPSGKAKKSDDNDSRHSTLDRTTGSDDNLAELSALFLMKSKSEHFADVKELKLDAQGLLYLWKNIMTSIGKVHMISKPSVHADVIQALVQVLDQLNRIRLSQPFLAQSIPCLFDFIGIFFRAAFMSQEYEKSISLSIGVICRIMCRRHERPVKEEWHVLFQHLLRHLLTNSTDAVRFTILQNCTKIYSLGLPGITLTIPSFMDVCSKLSLVPEIPSVVMKSMITILGSLIVYEKTYHTEVKTPYNALAEVEQPIEYTPHKDAKGSHIFEHLKYGIRDSLQNILNVQLKARNYEYCEMVLWNFAIMLIEEFMDNHMSSAKLQNEVLLILLEHISVRNIKVACAAADGLLLLAEAFPKLNFESDFILLVIEKIVWGISEHLVRDEKSKCTLSEVTVSSVIVSRLFRTLLEWLMVVPSSFVANPNISLRITEVIEETIHVALNGLDAVAEGQSPTKESSVHAGESSSLELQQLYNAMKESAENTLIHLFHHIDNFAPPYGVAMINSQINDFPSEDKIDFDNHHYLAFNNHTIIGFIDLPQEKKVRVLVRDPAGKFTWDMKYFYSSEKELDGQDQSQSVDLDYLKERTSFPSFKSTSYTESVGVIKGNDLLDMALTRFHSSHPECVYQNSPVEPTLDADQKLQKEIDSQVEQERNLPPREKQRHEVPASPSTEYFPFESARLLMSQLGFLTFDYLKEGTVHMLSKSPALFRDIKGLDKKFSRDVAKFAIIYVAPNQEDELSIFKNSQGSPQYEEFVRSLGWEVSLAEHPGYAGGLDCSVVKDGTAIYYCNSMVEMVFHDTTRMVCDENDPKLVKKKRHIGNDHVHIVWNEHYRDYRYDTIGGDFGNGQIVVTPLPNKLYVVDVYKDESVSTFGPLQSRSVVSKECLGILIRTTAMNAYRAAHAAGNATTVETHPYTIRKQNLEIISSRHKVAGDSYEKFMTTIFTEGIKVSSPVFSPAEQVSPAV